MTFAIDTGPAPSVRDHLPPASTITYHNDLTQGSDEWLAARCGLLTASEMKLIVTPSLKMASNDKERAHLYELLAQRITGYVEPHYISDDMLRGMSDEMDACIAYAKHYHPLRNVGFITNNKWGFTLGYSPDGLVGDEGAVECKSRRQKFQVQTIIEHVVDGQSLTIPSEYLIQHQTGLAVSERKWIDFISYCGGLPMAVIRVWPDDKIINAIIEIAGEFEYRLATALMKFRGAHDLSNARLIPTERKVEQEIF